MYHFLQNNFCLENKLTEMFVVFKIHFQQVKVLFYFSHFLLRLGSLVLKPVFVTKFARANPAFKTCVLKLLNSGLVIYLSWLWSGTFFSVSLIFVYFLTKLLILSILFSTAVKAAFVAKPLILGILPSISVILAL